MELQLSVAGMRQIKVGCDIIVVKPSIYFQAYDSVWREGLYRKLNNLGFGGRVLTLIKSMYCNDNLKFLINGKYTSPIWLTKGVKQGH